MASVKYLRDRKIAHNTLETLRLNLGPQWNSCLTQNVACWNLIKLLQLSTHQQVQPLQSAAGHVGYGGHRVRDWTLIWQLRERQRMKVESEWDTGGEYWRVNLFNYFFVCLFFLKYSCPTKLLFTLLFSIQILLQFPNTYHWSSWMCLEESTTVTQGIHTAVKWNTSKQMMPHEGLVTKMQGHSSAQNIAHTEMQASSLKLAGNSCSF